MLNKYQNTKICTKCKNKHRNQIPKIQTNIKTPTIQEMVTIPKHYRNAKMSNKYEKYETYRIQNNAQNTKNT